MGIRSLRIWPAEMFFRGIIWRNEFVGQFDLRGVGTGKNGGHFFEFHGGHTVRDIRCGIDAGGKVWGGRGTKPCAAAHAAHAAHDATHAAAEAAGVAGGGDGDIGRGGSCGLSVAAGAHAGFETVSGAGG